VMTKPRRKNSWTWFDTGLASLAVVAVCLLVLSYVRPRQPRASSRLQHLAERVEGMTLPDITFLADDSGTAGTAGFTRARATVVLLFQPGCSVCETNSPAWIAIQERVAKLADVRVLAVARGGTRSTALSWLRERGLEANAVLIPTTPTALGTDWRVFGVPATYVVDAASKVVLARFGLLTSAETQQVVVAAEKRAR
jgi:hypothetical protein